jgi:phosphoribosylformimino-5-aminoimidazole carboxamide ribotide isomerase
MIIPCIDLMGGTAVQLVQGRAKALDAGDPLAVLERFSAFPTLHVIDLDGAIGSGSNEDFVRQIASRVRVRTGGGIRSAEKARRLVEGGAEKIIIGTSAFKGDGVDTKFLGELLAAVGKERILVALDSKAGRIVIKGWREELKISAANVIQEMEPFCGGFLCTYVDKEGMMEGTNLPWFEELRGLTELELTAAGGISTYEEIDALQSIGVHVALGMAVYTGRLDLAVLARMQRPG